MKRIVLCGANGQVGQYLQKALGNKYEVLPVTRSQLDLTNIHAIQSSLLDEQPDLIINAAAYTAVDMAETDEQNAYLINRDAVAEMAKFSQQNNVPLIHYSTDYVFAGNTSQAYKESDTPDPDSIYGSSKLAGEYAIIQIGAPALILRTSWVYSNVGKNFYLTMKRLAAERDELGVVADQIGSPTYAGSIAQVTAKLVDKIFAQSGLNEEQKGVYHFTCSGQTSWHGFATELLRLNGFEKTKVNPIETSDFPTPAKRPAYSVLDNSKLESVFSIQLPDWQQALRDCVAEIKG